MYRTPPPQPPSEEAFSPELFTYTPRPIPTPRYIPPSPQPINNTRIFAPSQKHFRNIEKENQIKINYEECIQIKLENT